MVAIEDDLVANNKFPQLLGTMQADCMCAVHLFEAKERWSECSFKGTLN